VIGYLVSLGGAQVYSAQATIYLGQPYNQAGTAPVNTLQTNPSAVGQIVKAESVDDKVATQCKTKVSTFRKGISTQAIATGASTKGTTSNVSPLVTVTVQARKGKVATCAANWLAREVVATIGTYPAQKIATYQSHIAFDKRDIKAIQAALTGTSLDTDGKLILQTTLRSDQLDLSTYSGLLLEAKQVESPKISIPAAAHKVTARSRRNTVVIAALIGLILGAIAALLWDRVVPRLAPRNGNGV
jgi:hypothetical protein